MEKQTRKSKFRRYGDTGDKSDYVMEDDDKEDNIRYNSDINKNCNCQDPLDHRIIHNHH